MRFDTKTKVSFYKTDLIRDMIPKRRLRKRLTSDHRWGFTITLNKMEQLMIIHDTGSSKVKAANANAGLEYSFCVVFMLTQNINWIQIPPRHIIRAYLESIRVECRLGNTLPCSPSWSFSIES